MDAHTASYVRLLAIFHDVLALLALVASFFPGLYVALGWALLSGTFPGRRGVDAPPAIGWIFIAIGASLIAFILGLAALALVAGRFLRRRRHWTFCMVVAALCCAFVPFGTILGVFTILVLVKPEVKAAFGVVRPPVSGPPAAVG